MNSGNSRKAQKNGIVVEISLADGTFVYGKVFAVPQGRLTDVLNDDRDFLPVERADGSFVALAKTAIKQVTFPIAEGGVYRGSNPYMILGIKEGISREELKKAYHQLCFLNHPDRIRGFGLGPDYQELATQNMARINTAYDQILRSLNETQAA